MYHRTKTKRRTLRENSRGSSPFEEAFASERRSSLKRVRRAVQRGSHHLHHCGRNKKKKKLTTPKLPRWFASGLVSEGDSGVPNTADLLDPLGLTAATIRERGGGRENQRVSLLIVSEQTGATLGVCECSVSSSCMVAVV